MPELKLVFKEVPLIQPEDSIYRRVFVLGVLNGVFFHVAGAFLSGSTILPLFISQLTDSKVWIGLSGSIDNLFWFMPQLFAAAYTLHRTRQLGIYRRVALYRIICFALLVVVVFWFPVRQPALCLILVLFLYLVYALTGGLAGVSFMDIVGRTIPHHRRGSFFGLRMTLGGALGILAGLVVNSLLVEYEFPSNFGVIFLIAFFFIILGLSSFALVKEPEISPSRAKRSLAENIREAYAIFQSDRNYKALFWVRAAISAYLLGYPFYIIYAKQVLGYPAGAAGVFLSYEMAGYLVSNLLWAYLSDRVSNRLVLFLSALSAIIPPLIILLSFVVTPPLHIFALSFFFLGATASGLWVGFINYLLEIAPDEERPLYLGFLNSLISLTMLLPVLGGTILQLSSYEFLYGLLFVLALFGIGVSYRLYKAKDNPA